jgi:hypothetical protein
MKREISSDNTNTDYYFAISIIGAYKTVIQLLDLLLCISVVLYSQHTYLNISGDVEISVEAYKLN